MSIGLIVPARYPRLTAPHLMARRAAANAPRRHPSRWVLTLTQTLTYSATGLPTGLSISASSGLISGTPSAAGTYSVTVTAMDTTGATGASGSASFTGVQPGMFSPPEHHHHHDPHHIADPSDVTPAASGRLGYGVRRYRPRAGSPGWVVQWTVRLAVIAFIVYVAFQVFHGVTSSSSP